MTQLEEMQHLTMDEHGVPQKSFFQVLESVRANDFRPGMMHAVGFVIRGGGAC